MIHRFLLALAALSALALPLRAEVSIQEVTSPGGLKAWLVEEHSIPFTALELRFKGGASLDLPGKRGATALMTSLLEEGAGDLDARAFARATESLAASFSFRANDDAVAVSAKFLSENRDQAVALLRDALTAPRFDDDAIARVRAQVISNIRSDAKDPDNIAGEAYSGLLFGTHPYATDVSGSEESVAALTRGDLTAAQMGVLARDRVYISAVGDITPEELGALLDTLLGDLPAEGLPMPADIAPNFPGGIHVTDFDTPQSVVRFGQPGLAFDDPKFFAAYIIDTVLGGSGLESRLMREVREKRGLTYGVYTYLVDKDHADYWSGSVASANDRVSEAIEVIRAEWQKMHDEGLTAEELQDAKTYLTGAFPLRFDGNGPIANIMVNMQTSGMPLDYIATRNDKVNAVTLEEVNALAKELIDPAKLTFVVVGQPQGLSN